MSLIDDVMQGQEAVGKEIEAKRVADRIKKDAAEKAKKDAVAAEKQHEEDKRQGMI